MGNSRNFPEITIDIKQIFDPSKEGFLARLAESLGPQRVYPAVEQAIQDIHQARVVMAAFYEAGNLMFGEGLPGEETANQAADLSKKILKQWQEGGAQNN